MRKATRPEMNVLVIAVDTLRASRLSCYGYPKPTSPTIDQLAAEGVLFERMLCAGIPTHPSFTTFYTGQHPITHGIVAHGGKAVLDRKAPHLARLFLRAGWTTAAVDNLASSRDWFQWGYEFYIDPSRRRALGLMVSCEQQNERAIQFLQHYADEPFFLFVHYWDPHTPYLPPEPYREMFYDGNAETATDPTNRSLEPLWKHPLGQAWRDTWFKALGGNITDAEYVRALYDGSIRYCDDGIAALLEALDAVGRREDTLVVLFGDHGECLGEHGIWFDHHGLYEENVHVPLLIRWPGRLPAGLRIPETVQTTDIAPTLLDLAGLEPPETMDGQSLRSLFDAGAPRPYVPVERVYTPECTWQAKWSLRTDRYTFILARSIDFYGSPPRELYDRKVDPGETHNLVEELPELTEQLEAELEEWIARELARTGRSIDPVIAEGRDRFNARWKRSPSGPEVS